MQRRARDTVNLKSFERAAALRWRLLLAGFTLWGCQKPAVDTSCVPVGSGWKACSAEQSESTGEGTGRVVTPPSAAANSDAGRSLPAAPTRTGSSSAARAGAAAEARSNEAGAQAQPVGAAAAPATASTAAQGGSGGARPAAQSGAGATAENAGAAVLAGRGADAGSNATAGRAGVSGSDAGTAGTSALPTACCHALGICVQSQELRDDQRPLLTRDSCLGTDALCAPLALLDQKQFVPGTCRSVINAEGRCLPDCISNLVKQADRLPRDGCGEHEVCAPCFDPITGNATGICSLGSDPGPSELPQLFAGCCGESSAAQGLCVPPSYLPERGVWPQASCGADLVCAAQAQVRDPNAQPATCTAEVRGPGVCLPRCVVEELGVLTVQSTCNASEACFPCTLVNGTATGACPGA